MTPMEEEGEDAIKTRKDFIGALKKTGSPEAIRLGLPARGADGVNQNQCELSAAAKHAEHEQQADHRERRRGWLRHDGGIGADADEHVVVVAVTTLVSV